MPSPPTLLDRTSSPGSGLLGVQTPQIVHRPPDVVSLDAATAAIELADAYKICDGHPLDESQQFTLMTHLGRRDDGSWAASRVADFEPRQAGKNDAINARELSGLLLFGERLQIHTAHLFPTANESFLRMVEIWENWDDLRRRVARIRWAAGEQGVELLTGQRLLYRTRSAGQGRGFAKADLTVYDEAQHLAVEHVAASAPAKLVATNSQSYYAGSGGLSTSEIAWRMRLAALRGDAGRLAYVEHTAELITLDANGRVVSVCPDLLDRRAWARAYAPYGTRVTDEKLLDQYDELGPEKFARECLNVWDPLPEAVGEEPAVIAGELWASRHDPGSAIVGGAVIAVDAAPGMAWSSVAAVGRRRDRRAHGEMIARRPGSSWVPEHLAGVLARNRVRAVGVDAGGPVAAILPELAAVCAAAGVDLVRVSGRDYAAACAALKVAVIEDKVRHLGQEWLADAVGAGVARKYGDGWMWERRNSSADVSPVAALTVGLRVLEQLGPERTRRATVHSF